MPEPDPEGRYQFVGELGRGGMGAVLKGRDTEIGRDLAIKVLLERFSGDQELLDRFIDEAQIGGQLQHPGIAPVYEMGKFEDNRPYFTMKLIKGSTLAEILAERDSPKDDWPKLLPIFEQVCQTIAYAHSKGVIHRDLKPSNIMVGAFGEVQVMDWGLAKVLDVGGDADEKMQNKKDEDATFIQTRRSSGDSDSGGSGSATRAGSGMGTPAYMPPEQALGEIDSLDERADVFGLGAILAEILTGKPAYVGEELVMQARRGRIKECLKRIDASGADEALVGMAKKALEPESKDRQRHAGVLSDQVTRYLEGVQERLKESELAKVAAETRVVEERRRKKLQLAIAGMIATLAASAAILAWQFYRYEQSQILLIKSKRDAELQEAEFKATEKAFAIANRITSLTNSANEADADGFGMAYAQRAAKESLALVKDRSDRESSKLATKALAALLRQGQNVGGFRLGDGSLSVQPNLTEDNEKDWSLAVGCIEFSPDGRWLAAGCRLWDMEAPDPELTMVQFSQQEANDLIFHPSSRWLICVGKDGSNLVTELASSTGNDFSQFSIDGLGSELAFSADGKQLVSANRKSATIELLEWPYADGNSKRQSIECPSPVWYAEFSPDNRWLAIDGFNSPTLLLDLSQDADKPLFYNVGNSFSKLAFSADSQWFLTKNDNDGAVHAWSLASGQPSDNADLVLRDNAGSVNWILPFENSDRVVTLGPAEPIVWDLSADDPASSGKKLYNGLEGGFIPTICQDRWLVTWKCIWDLRTAGQEDAKPVVTDFGFGPLCAISPSGKWLAHGSWAYPFPRVWKFDQVQFTLSPIALRSPGCHLVSFDSKGDRLFTHGFYTRPLQRYDLSVGGKSFRDNMYDPCSLEIAEAGTAACLSNNGDWFAEGDLNGQVSVFSMNAKPSSPTFRLQVTEGEPVHALGISNDGNSLLVASGTQTVKLWDLDREEPIATIPVSAAFPSKPMRTILKFSNDQRWLQVMLQTVHSEFFEIEGNRLSGKSFVIPSDNGGRNITWIGPKSRWAFSRYGKSGWLWDLKSKAPDKSAIELVGLNDIQFPYVFSFSHDGSLVAAGTQSAQAAVWKIDAIEQGQRTLEPWRTVFPSVSTIWSLAISPDNRWLACGTIGSLILVWDLEEENPKLSNAIRLQGPKEMENQNNHISSLAFCPDSKRSLLASVTAESDTVRLWNLDLESAIQDIENVAGYRVEEEDLADWE